MPLLWHYKIKLIQVRGLGHMGIQILKKFFRKDVIKNQDLVEDEMVTEERVLRLFKNITLTGQLDAGIASSRFLNKYAEGKPLFRDRTGLIQYALQYVKKSDGVFAEFGVYTGSVTNFICSSYPYCEYHAFDSWEGLPESMSACPKSSFDLNGQIPELPENVIAHKGWFSDTLPSWSSSLSKPLEFVYIDCDLYSSTVCVLEAIKKYIRVGTVVMFDDWYNFFGWQYHGAKAFSEYLKTTKQSFDILGLTTQEHSVAFICNSLNSTTPPQFNI
jgi:hypothetical protein